MRERTIRDRAGDLWTVEDASVRAGTGTRAIRCRHELGYELLITIPGQAPEDDAALLGALERARRVVPSASSALLTEAA